MKSERHSLVFRSICGMATLLVVLLLSSHTQAQSLFGKKWALSEIDGDAVNSTRAYIEFDGSTKRISGDGGCNRFAGTFEINEAAIRFSQTMSTKRACVDQGIQRIENSFLNRLQQVTEFQIQGDVLSLKAHGRTILTFRSDSSGTDTLQEARLTGRVSYRQRIALPASAIVKVRLLDVSRADTSSIMMVEQVIRPNGQQPPFAFDLVYDPGRIREYDRYIVQARIENRGRLLFINTYSYPVITNGHPNTVDVIVRPVRR